MQWPEESAMLAAPINLSDDEMNLLMNLAQPLDPALRPQFLEAVAQELEATRQAGEIGERSVHRLARQIQRKYWDTAAAAERGNARLKGEVQSWNTTGEAAIIGRRASWLFRIGQRWGHNLPPTKATMGVAGMQVGASSVPATLYSKRPDAKPGPGARSWSPGPTPNRIKADGSNKTSEISEVDSGELSRARAICKWVGRTSSKLQEVSITPLLSISVIVRLAVGRSPLCERRLHLETFGGARPFSR
jgi:hypothetical protein